MRYVIIILFGMMLLSSNIYAQISFAPKVDFATGNEPLVVVIKDMRYNILCRKCGFFCGYASTGPRE
jgi:hypothetical protein